LRYTARLSLTHTQANGLNQDFYHIGGIMVFSIEELASLLADAHLNGWRDGHMLCPPPDLDSLYLRYNDDMTRMCSEHVEH
jgi:hypothetical protein